MAWSSQASPHRGPPRTAGPGVIAMGRTSLAGGLSLLVGLILMGAVLRTVVLGSSLRVGFGGGFSFNSIKAASRADDGRKGDLLVPKTGQLGYLALLSADLILLPGFPVWLSGGLNSHWVHFHTCSGSDPPQYDPFCSISRFGEAELGLTIAF